MFFSRALRSNALFLPLGGVAVGAAVDVPLRVAEEENGVQLGLRHGDAPGVLAPDDVHQLLGGMEAAFLRPDAVPDDVDGDFVVDIAQHVHVHVHGGVDFDDVLFPHPAAADVFDDGHGAVQLVQVEVFVDVHALARLDVVQDHAVLDAVNVHRVLPFPLDMDVQQLQNQGHADELSVFHLLPVGGPGVLVHRHGNLVHPGQGVEDGEVRLGGLQLLRGEDIAVL